MITEVPLATFDAGRMGWSSMPRAFVILGYALPGTGIALSTWALAVNPFFELGVRVQRERGQQVISKGPYATVRHPGYASALMIFAGLALSLASWWALIPAAIGGYYADFSQVSDGEVIDRRDTSRPDQC